MRAFLYALPVKDIEFLAVYKRLPLHCTLMHWFVTEANQDQLRTVTERVFRNHGPIRLESAKRAIFGLHNDVPVHRVRKTRDLMSLHFNLHLALGGLGVTHTNESWVGRGYNPHVTDQGEAAFLPGSQHVARYVYLVEALDPAMLRPKKVMEMTQLGV